MVMAIWHENGSNRGAIFIPNHHDPQDTHEHENAPNVYIWARSTWQL
jgi:hypothetical protein